MSTSVTGASKGFISPDLGLAHRARAGDARGLALEAARTLVGEGLVKPVFAELREGGFAADGFKPGAAERRFRPLLDAALVDRIVERNGFDLVERTADRFERTIAARSGATGGAR